MPKKKLRLGAGAQCSPLMKNVHPQAIIRSVFPVYADNERLVSAIATKKATVTRKGKTYVAVFFEHVRFEGQEIYCALRYANQTAEGEPINFFDTAAAADVPAPSVTAEPRNIIDSEVLRAGNNAEDIALVRAQGHDVDDDNEPAPENIPTDDTPGTNEDDGLYPGQSWGHESFVDPMNNRGWRIFR
eukprot:scaffold118478_cov62-Cyclotella_meneghiniana.AAC.8